MAIYDEMTPSEKELFWSMDPIAQEHPLVRDEKGVIRFQADPLLRALHRHGSIPYITVHDIVEGGIDGVTIDDLRRLRRNIGYSLASYCIMMAKDEELGYR